MNKDKLILFIQTELELFKAFNKTDMADELQYVLDFVKSEPDELCEYCHRDVIGFDFKPAKFCQMCGKELIKKEGE